MLKIKDDVDLKELEKFGFKKQPKSYCGYYLCISRGCKIIFVSEKAVISREIMIDKWYDNDPRIHKRPNCKYRSNKVVEDIIYDLTKADLVEKVGG